jgi:S-DNA-T family DNA segregation ATPase FtsK/SpoIIIE
VPAAPDPLDPHQDDRPTAGLSLDAFTRFYIADFKARMGWAAAAQVAHRFLSGGEPAHVLALLRLAELVTEVQARYRRMRQLGNEVCPGSLQRCLVTRRWACRSPELHR